MFLTQRRCPAQSGLCMHRKQKEKRVELLTALAMGFSGLWVQLYTSLTQAGELQEKQQALSKPHANTSPH